MMEEEKKALVSDMNPYLLCSLCSGYMVDASTIIECLHSFCRSCIYKYLESSKYCPICDIQIHKTKPHLNIKADKTLQTLIYKLVPNLLRSELKRRQDFVDSHPDTDVGSLSIILPTEHHHILDRYKFLRSLRDQSRWISLCIRPITCSQGDALSNSTEINLKEVNSTRYFFCPPDVRIVHIKKLLREKFELDEDAKVDLLHSEKAIADYSLLSTVTEDHGWDRQHPFEINYSIKIPTGQTSKIDEDEVTRFMSPSAFKSRLQDRLRELQLKSRHRKLNKRKLKALGTDSSCTEERIEAKRMRMRFSFGRNSKNNSKYHVGRSLSTRSSCRDELFIPPFASFLPSSGTINFPPPSSAPVSSSSSSPPPSSSSPPVLQPSATRSNLSDTATSTNERPYQPSDLLSSPQSSAFIASSSVLSISSSKSGEDCVVTDVTHKRTLGTSSLRKNRNIFDLVRPLLKSSFNKNLQQGSSGTTQPSRLMFTLPPSRGTSPLPIPISSTSSNPLSCSSSTSSLVVCDCSEAKTASESCSTISMMEHSTPASQNEFTDGNDPPTESAERPNISSYSTNSSRSPTCTIARTSLVASNSLDHLDAHKTSSIFGRLSSFTTPGWISSEKVLPRKSFSVNALEERSNFFEKFSNGFKFNLGSIKSSKNSDKRMPPLNKNYETNDNNDGRPQIESQKKNFSESSRHPSPNIYRSTKKTKEKTGFEASCEEGSETTEKSLFSADKFSASEFADMSCSKAATRSYKISKREMCGLFMNMSKKYLKEFPANGFALDSTMSEENRHHRESSHQRRSKHKLTL